MPLLMLLRYYCGISIGFCWHSTDQSLMLRYYLLPCDSDSMMYYTICTHLYPRVLNKGYIAEAAQLGVVSYPETEPAIFHD